MTDEQMRIAIAESVGYKELFMDNGKSMVPQRWESPYDEFCYVAESLPDYLNDLNAMHEAEKTFADDDVIAEKYWLALYDATEHTRWPYDATARQRAEAFLKTKGIIP